MRQSRKSVMVNGVPFSQDDPVRSRRRYFTVTVVRIIDEVPRKILRVYFGAGRTMTYLINLIHESTSNKMVVKMTRRKTHEP